MKLTFLKASIPLTKTYVKTSQGIEKSSYPNVYEVTSITEEAKSLKDLAILLREHGALGHCLLKGNVTRDLVNESRAGTTDPNAVTYYAVLDVDGSSHATPDEFMKAIGLGNTSYVVQYSPSYRVFDKSLRCHIFLMMSEPLAAPVLKQLLIALNFSVASLKADLALTKTGNALRYPLDITTCQNDKLIYIAPPTCKGFPDPLKDRVAYVKKKHDTWAPKEHPSVVLNRAMIEEHIAVLREKAKLPKRKNTYKLVNNIEVLVKPDQSIVTGMKEERGFVYFNLNGGDSWGYYHPSNNPDFIHNFKGESTYLTKELLPEYWQEVCQHRRQHRPPTAPTVKGTTFLAFLDRRSGAYWRGMYDAANNKLELYVAKNETQLRHFAAQNGFSMPEYVPEWEIVFEPNETFRIDEENHRVNIFQPTDYMLAKSSWAGKKKKPQFPIIEKITRHALGGDDVILKHWYNWLAYIVQKRARARTAWVMHGRTGTGKGLLMNEILSRIFGASQVAVKRMEELSEPYNGYMERCFVVFVDEVQTSVLRNERGVMAKIKNFITEPTISVRNMYQNAYPAANHTNWIFASNMPDPVAVDMNDRRFNVGKYQAEPLVITAKEVAQIPSQLQGFYDFLMAWPVDETAATTPLETEDRTILMKISEASIDTVAKALLDGDFGFFVDALPTNIVNNSITMDLVEDYKATLIRLYKRCQNEKTMECKISRDELRTIFEWTVGDMPKSPNKFTSRLKHHRIHTVRLRIDGSSVHGISTVWKAFDKESVERLFPPVVAATKGKKK